MRMHEIFTVWIESINEPKTQIASGADQTMKLAQKQVKRAQIQKTQSKLANQQKQLSDIGRP
ncbi:hypothetical protein CCP1ISM_40015 [Azospirillaceae bacterium]